MTSPLPKIDVLIVVPKGHELREFERAFEVTLRSSTGALDCGVLWYAISVRSAPARRPLSAVAIFLNDQGSSATTRAVTEAMHVFAHPPLAFLLGTAGGRKGKTKFGDVVVSTEGVLDVTQMVVGPTAGHRPTQHFVEAKIKADVDRFLAGDSFVAEWKTTLAESASRLSDGDLVVGDLWPDTPRVHDKMVAGGDSLYEAGGRPTPPKQLEKIWSLSDHLRAIDMESAGFCAGIRSQTRRCQWLVVRGISDYGTLASRQSKNKRFGSLAAAIWLRLFLEGGLNESHPDALRPPIGADPELPSESLFAATNVRSLIESVQHALAIKFDHVTMSPALTMADVFALCVAQGISSERARSTLATLRAEYFTSKYLDYEYDMDLRGLVTNWHEEVNGILVTMEVNVESSVVLSVGIGTGQEAGKLFSNARQLIGVDVSEALLARAKATGHVGAVFCEGAENLASIESASIDLYSSLRTFQSSLFDIDAAVREAYRVLRRGGVMVVSVANGFVENAAGGKRIARGLVVPGTRTLDRGLPYRTAHRILDRLHDLGFGDVGLQSINTDVYVFARKS